MADMNAVYDALRNAHAAGDTAAATKLANYIQSQGSQPVQQESIQGSSFGGVIQGMRDPIDEAAAMLPKGLQAITSLGGYAPNSVSQYFGDEASRVQGINKQNEVEYQQARQQSGREGVDAARIGGNIASPVNIATAVRLGGKAMSVGSGMKVGAVGGALSGGEDVNSEDYWKGKAQNTAIGTAVGGAIPSVVGGVARVVKPQTNQQAADLLRQGVTPTMGQILGGTAQKVEEKLQSVPLLGDAITHAKGKTLEEFNRVALNRALTPIGQSTDDIGRTGVASVKQKISDAYDELLPKLSFIPDQQFQQQFATVRQMAQGLGAKEQSKFNAIINDVFSKASPNGQMTGETFKIAESKLSAEAKSFAGSTDAYQKELGAALAETLRIMRESLPRTNPQYGDRLQKVNEAFANYARIRAAASSTATGAREGVFTPSQLATAVRQMDQSAGKGASATGKALMQDLAEQGTNILGSKVADSGTAGRVMLGTGLGGGAVATGTAIPVGAGLGVASLPYLGVGRKLAASLVSKRPAQAEQLARLLRQTSPALAGSVPFAMLNDK